MAKYNVSLSYTVLSTIIATDMSETEMSIKQIQWTWNGACGLSIASDNSIGTQLLERGIKLSFNLHQVPKDSISNTQIKVL